MLEVTAFELLGITMSIKITSVQWDRRPKTKFLTIEGVVHVESYEDSVEVSFSNPQGVNGTIALFDLEVKSSNGPKKPQLAPFRFQHMTLGSEEWTEVQVKSKNGSCSDTSLITILTFASSKDTDSISSLVGKLSRVYTTGDALTEDFRPDRVNIELNEQRHIISIWMG